MNDLSTKLFEILRDRFKESELRTLCFYLNAKYPGLNVDYDSLSGEGKKDKARELVQHLQRHDGILKLVEIGQELRHDISWNETLDVMEANNANLGRQRDLETLRKIFESINTDMLDYFFYTTRMLDRFDDAVFFFWDGFASLVISSNFHIYNDTLAEKIDRFYASWQDTLSFGDCFVPIANYSYRFIAVYEGYDQNPDQWEAAHSRYRKAIESAESTFIDLIKYVKENYIELDIDQTNELSLSSYKAYLARIHRRLGKN